MNEDDLVLVIGREHLEAAKWGHGDWNFDNLPQVPLSEGFKINRVCRRFDVRRDA